MTILGLDISSSIMGISILEHFDDNPLFPKIVKLDHIDLRKEKDFWKKVDIVKNHLNDIKIDVTHLYIEEIAKMFSPGMSSAGTITKLAGFNRVVSYLAREKFGLDPNYLSPAEARKLCGLKLQTKKKCGISHKEQVFRHMIQNDLKHVAYPLKRRSMNYVDWAYDECDAYVVSKAGIMLNS